MKKYQKILQECPLFDGIEEDDLFRMLVCLGARVESFDKKYTVIAEGNPARYIGIVLAGSVQIIRIDYTETGAFCQKSVRGNCLPKHLPVRKCAVSRCR